MHMSKKEANTYNKLKKDGREICIVDIVTEEEIRKALKRFRKATGRNTNKDFKLYCWMSGTVGRYRFEAFPEDFEKPFEVHEGNNIKNIFALIDKTGKYIYLLEIPEEQAL